MTRLSLIPLLLTALAAAEVPLPPAPVRLQIADPAAFDRALTGTWRAVLQGAPPPGEPVMAAWRQERIGMKLDDQWRRFTADLALDWGTLQKLQPKGLGLAILEVGQLEAVLVIETALAQLPLPLPQGTPRSHGGVAYHVVTPGAGDGSEDADRRMGLSWARTAGRLLLATSERALKLALDAGLKPAPPSSLPGLVALELDLTVLRKDRYFQREFPFPEGPESGTVRAALRLEQGQLVEVREGVGEDRPGVWSFHAPGAALAGWEPAGSAFWPAFRRGLLEPLPNLEDRPVPALTALPAVGEAVAEDRYGVDFRKPRTVYSGSAWEAGDLAAWGTLLEAHPVPHWGYWVDAGARRIVFPWPADQDVAFAERCRATAARRAGKATLVQVGDTREVRVGPDLTVLALRRTGPCLWVGPSAASLSSVPAPQAQEALVRWAQVDLEAVRAEGTRWASHEGAGSPEQVRVLSDRVLGLLGWIPATRALRVERRRTEGGWTERVHFLARP